MKILQDIWIIYQGGSVIFKEVIDSEVNTQIFGGYISALTTFATQITAKGMSAFEVGDKNFIIQNEGKLMFIANYPSNLDRKAANKELEGLIKKFQKLYPKDIFEHWNGDVSIFDYFKTQI